MHLLIAISPVTTVPKGTVMFVHTDNARLGTNELRARKSRACFIPVDHCTDWILVSGSVGPWLYWGVFSRSVNTFDELHLEHISGV